MEPKSEIKQPVQVERKASALKAKVKEIAKKAIPEKTRQWLLKAGKELQHKDGRKALEILSASPIENGQKETSPTTPDVVQSETITQKRLTQYSEERKALGLREERTLQEIAQEKERQRKEAIDSFLSDRKSEKKTETPPTFEDILQQGREKAKSVRDVLSTREKTEIAVRRTKALAIMTAKGIRNPERVLQILEAESGNDSGLRYINLENIGKNDYWSKYEREKAIGEFHSIYERAQSSEFINGCRQIGNVSTVCERMHQMRARFSLDNIGRQDAEQLIPMVQKLARIPNEQFSTMLDDLHQYNFLFPERSYSVEDNLTFQPLVDFMSSNTQITAEQRQVLDMARRIYQIGAPGTYGYRDFHPLLSKHDPSVLLSNKERIADELIVFEQLTLDLYDNRERPDSNLGSHWKQKYLYEKNTFVSAQIEQLAKTGDLHILAELIRNGFMIGTDNAWAFTDEYRREDEKLKTVQEDIHRSANLLTKFSDTTLLSEVLLIEDLRQSEYPGYETLSIGRSKLFESLVREKSSSQQALQVAVSLVNKLTEDPAKRVQLLNNRFILFDDNLGMSLNIASLLSEVKSSDILDKLPQEDQLFWRTMLDWEEHKFQWLGESHDFISLFLIQNQSRFNEFFQEGKLTDSFFNEFTNYFNKVPDKYYTDQNIKKGYIISSINGFLLDPEQAPPSIRGIAEAFTEAFPIKDRWDLQSIYEDLGTDYNKWSSLVTDGKPNINLVSLILENSAVVNIANRLLTTDMVDKLPENQRNFWNVWKDVADCSKEMSLFLFRNGGRFADFYQDKHLTPAFLEEFYKDAFSKGTQVDTYGLNMLIRDGFLDNFPRTDFAIWNAINQGNSYPSRQFAVEHLSEIKGYFNEKGEPNARLLVYLAKGGTVDLQQAFLSEEALNTFNETEQAFWRGWRNLPDRGKIIFNQKLDNNPQITESLVKEIKIFNTLFEEIEQSPSQELQKIKDQLISLLLENSQPEQALRKVRALFERNNLPDFGKKFRIFEILYCTQETDGKTRFDREMEQKGEKLSPILRKASRLRRLDTIYKDLLRINIDSGDVSLKNYLTAMQEGQVLLDRIEAQGTSSLSSAEARRVTRFLNRLNVLYENSLLGRQRIKAATPLPDFLSLEARIASLKEDLQVKEGQRIIDRVSEMFVKPLGYESIDAVLAHMDSIKEQAHNRNLSNPRVQEGQLEINAGDLLKGIQDDVLGYILQNGSIAREYIGVNAYSDSTPFDTDTGMVLQEDLEGGLPHVISSSPAQGYGNLIIVVRNRGQFVRTDQQETVNLQYNPQNYELFHSGVVGERHYGVRTGFPATEIDAVILKQDLLDETQANMLKREGIFFNIANNGFYVPVVNPEGKVIFTEADYNKYRLNQQLITANLASEEFKPNEFIDSLKSSPYLKTLYEMDSGVGEGYSTEQHTSMVMSQFEKYFSRDFESTFLTKDDFRLMLSLHDIGKPVAVYATGSTNAQHEYTKKVLVYALQATGTQPNKVDTILSLVDQDILGEYFKGQTDAQNSVQQISELAETVGVSPNDLVEALKMYYICDAGSYTTDAGGQASLDSLFVFNHNEGNNSVTFSEKNEAKYQELLNLIKS